MSNVNLQPMTAEFYRPWIAKLMSGYAEEQIAAGSWSRDEASARVQAETEALLPAGLDTPDQLLLTAFNDAGEAVGALWIAVRRPQEQGAWIYEI